ncbi:hypothetical protein [Brockia lithotrophica]|uniref:Spore cortex biosynthesis protein YabQ n=1 Tax=Brockia lithotrophica TaxID=933949 RepID=A0A660KZ39_9BACL|nr:hypothetical protein [Brockia lithotrophica]RKQ85624.1 hypothetical protein C7438_1029 [Brockia lithotrophica]
MPEIAALGFAALLGALLAFLHALYLASVSARHRSIAFHVGEGLLFAFWAVAFTAFAQVGTGGKHLPDLLLGALAGAAVYRFFVPPVPPRVPRAIWRIVRSTCFPLLLVVRGARAFVQIFRKFVVFLLRPLRPLEIGFWNATLWIRAFVRRKERE